MLLSLVCAKMVRSFFQSSQNQNVLFSLQQERNSSSETLKFFWTTKNYNEYAQSYQATLCNNNMVDFIGYNEAEQRASFVRGFCQADKFYMFGMMAVHHKGHCNFDGGDGLDELHYSWNKAKQKCQEISAHLPVLTSREDAEQFSSFIKFSHQFHTEPSPLIQRAEGKASASALSNEFIFVGLKMTQNKVRSFHFQDKNSQCKHSFTAKDKKEDFIVLVCCVKFVALPPNSPKTIQC